MIYQVSQTASKNEFIVNTMVRVKVIYDNNKEMKTELKYDNNILTSNEASELSREFLTYFNSLHH